MPISIKELRSASLRFAKTATLAEARSLNLKKVFLCHSHLDEQLVRGLWNLFAEKGWQVYVDWEDAGMPESPTRETAEKIQRKIRDLNYFVFLATPNSVKSRWCPWEIGFADSAKGNENILIVPTTGDSGEWYGNEYLQLYRKIDLAKDGNFGVWTPGQSKGVWLHNL